MAQWCAGQCNFSDPIRARHPVAGRETDCSVVLVFARATQIKTYSWGNAQVVLVANKVDLEEDRQVPAEDGQRLATELGQHHTRNTSLCSS